jgi:hypothetical protein
MGDGSPSVQLPASDLVRDFLHFEMAGLKLQKSWPYEIASLRIRPPI